MSDNYPSDVKLNENPNGTVSFATEVVATIAGLAATEVDGVASMASPSSGLADMFSRKSNRGLTKGVRIDLDDNRVSVDITITVEYGSPVPDVARNIQENVKKAIETMSGLDVKNVDVHITGISFEREQRANAQLDEQHRKMLEKTAEAEGSTQLDAPVGESAPVIGEENAETSAQPPISEDGPYDVEFVEDEPSEEPIGDPMEAEEQPSEEAAEESEQEECADSTEYI